MALLTFQEKCKRGLIKVGMSVEYQPYYAKCFLDEKETGWKTQQKIETEKEISYRFAGFQGKQPLLLADRVTNQKIRLSGMIGYKQGPVALNKVIKVCYSSSKYGAEGFILTEEILLELPKKLWWYTHGLYWLGSQHVSVGSTYAVFGLCVVDHASLYYDSALALSNGLTYSGCRGVRPAVILPSDILLDDRNYLSPLYH